MGEEKDLLSTLLLELRRGTLTISVLSQMNKPKIRLCFGAELGRKRRCH